MRGRREGKGREREVPDEVEVFGDVGVADGGHVGEEGRLEDGRPPKGRDRES